MKNLYITSQKTEFMTVYSLLRTRSSAKRSCVCVKSIVLLYPTLILWLHRSGRFFAKGPEKPRQNDFSLVPTLCSLIRQGCNVSNHAERPRSVNVQNENVNSTTNANIPTFKWNITYVGSTDDVYRKGRRRLKSPLGGVLSLVALEGDCRL